MRDFPQKGDWIIHRPSGLSCQVEYSYQQSNVVGLRLKKQTYLGFHGYRWKSENRPFGGKVFTMIDRHGGVFVKWNGDFDVVELEKKDLPVFQFLFPSA